MKDERKNIKELAERIANLEKECQFATNVSESMNKIEQLIQNLSLEEMLELDMYIQENKLLTK